MISEQLRQAIHDSGETMYAVARGSGLSFPVVSRFVHGQRDIRLGTADAICEYLRLRLTDEKPKRRAAKRGRRK